MSEEKPIKTCELCKEQPATTLCAECYKCYCERCTKLIHDFPKFKEHRTEVIPEGVVVNAVCSLHGDTPLEMLCIDEVKLCCAMCREESLHEKHTFVKASNIQSDNETFSAQKVGVCFDSSLICLEELYQKVMAALENIKTKSSNTLRVVKQTFKEEHEKLNKEEEQITKELETIKNRNEEVLCGYLDNLKKVRDHGILLSKVDTKIKSNCSRLMELNIVSEKEKQRKVMEALCEEEMEDLQITWNNKRRVLSYTKNLFNGAPVPSNVTFPVVLCREAKISWKCDVSKVREKDRNKVSYFVEMKKSDNGKWAEVYSGSEMSCTVKDLDMGTEYIVHIKCSVNGLRGKWSKDFVLKTQEIHFPKNVIIRTMGWDTMEILWEDVVGASSYKVEMKKEGDKKFVEVYSGKETNFTKRGLLSDKEYSFRVCTMKGSEMSEWNDVAKRSIQEEFFVTSFWKECPDNVDEKRKYSVDVNNPRIATKVEDGNCTIIGNASLPSNQVSSWNIKILKSRNNNGGGILIGVAPFDIDQNNGDNNFNNCGWYFYCYRLALCSGPPHNYKDKDLKQIKKWGSYVHTGDTVGVVMDTTKGDLSFTVNRENFSSVYKDIPLDKPLVPCILLKYKNDSVEFVI